MPVISRFFGIVVAMGSGEATQTVAGHFPLGVSTMIPHIVQAEYKGGYRIWLRFDDGAEGTVDLQAELYGEMFEPLKDVGRFKSFRIDPELETLVWSNGADFAPEFLRSQLPN